MGKSLGLLFRHNLWANLRLLDCCARVSEDLLDAAAPGTYGKVRDTLVHLLAAEQRYVEALTGEPNPETWNEEKDFPGFDALRRSAEYSGGKLIETAETIAHDAFRTGTYRGRPYEIPAAVFLVQAIHHALEHRSHIVTILSQHDLSRYNVELPMIDGWTFEEEIRAQLARESKP